MALAGAYGTAMAVELEMGPIMEWKTPARGHNNKREAAGEDCPKALREIGFNFFRNVMIWNQIVQKI